MLQPPSSSDSSKAVVAPKVFISYSWTTPGHQAQVLGWAERLAADGVAVVMDAYDLKEGHDKYHFMEKMVTDQEITHVLMFCDQVYAKKADAKIGGVGTESQIISSEVYEKVQQSKFIPIACELPSDSEPYLPIFLRSRIWIDFTSQEAVNQNWERLIRLLHGKPAIQKPSLGKPPAYITEETTFPTSAMSGKYATLKQSLLTNGKSLRACREDFLLTCIEYAEAFRVRKDPNLDQVSLGQLILEDCGKLKLARNHVIDWVLLEGGPTASEEFKDDFMGFLESLSEVKSRPAGLNSYNYSWFEAEVLFVYETFLYLVAALLKKSAYSLLHDVFTSHYLKPQSERHSGNQFDTFGAFWGQAGVLQSALSGGRLFYSPAAELIKRQADRPDIPFGEIMQAELLATLMTWVTDQASWFPQTLNYLSQSDFPFFVRAARHRDYLKLAIITGISDADVLRATVKAAIAQNTVNQWPGIHMPRSFWECLNMSLLDSLT